MNLNKLFEYDKVNSSSTFLIGCDEAGRGPGAGDVFCAAVCFLNTSEEFVSQFYDLDDSKKLTENKRNELFGLIIKASSKDLLYSIVPVSIADIERYDILTASLMGLGIACKNVAAELISDDVTLFVDGQKKIFDIDYEQKNIIKGDSLSASIAAASVLAKVARDEYMQKLDAEFPMYNWAHNKGYLSSDHLDAIDEYGLSKYHRASFLKKHFARTQQLSFNL